MKLPLTAEEEAWLARVRPVVESPKKKPAVDPVPVLSDAEVAWLWPRFQGCRHQVGSFARSFARTAFDKLTVRGKACLDSVAYVYRAQIFGKDAKKWGRAEFIKAVRRAAR